MPRLKICFFVWPTAVFFCFAQASSVWAEAPTGVPVVDAKPVNGDTAKKLALLNSPRWQRAVFELSQWLGSQQIYSPSQVSQIKRDFNERVASMSSFDIEYLMDDLDAKFKAMETPDAKEARAWLGQYLSVISDQRRAVLLKDVPDVVSMSASQLEAELRKIEAARKSLLQQQQGFDQSRDLVLNARQQSIQATQRAASSPLPGNGVSYSPYSRGGQGGGSQPFSDVKGSGMNVGVGPFGAYMSMSVSQF